MDTLEEMRTAVQSDLTITDGSTLFPPTTIDLAINRAYRIIGAMFRWPETEDAKKTSTEADAEYYDYPQNWLPNSIWRLAVDGIYYGEEPDYAPMKFSSYLSWKKDYPNSTDKKWANQWRRYFISPTPSTDGDNNICVWGQKVVDKLTADGSVTIFSYGYPHMNEAIVLEAGAILKRKGEDNDSKQLLSSEAREIVVLAWGKIRQELSKYDNGYSMFEVPDFFGSGISSRKIGDFDL